MKHGLFAAILFSCSLAYAQAPAPQSARQALIEMFFGNSPNHLERHLAEVTRKSFMRMNSSEGQSLLAELSSLSSQIKAGGAKVETFETGPTILTVEDRQPQNAQRIEVTVDRDDLIGDEDEIELALHLPAELQQQALPLSPHFTFVMKTEADVWRLTDITVTVKFPLADPDFLKGIEDSQRKKNEQMTMWMMRQVNTSEQLYLVKQGKYACSLAVLGRAGRDGTAYLYDPQLASGNKNGYVFVISECDGSHYKVVAEPAIADSGQRAFCSDEGGAVRASDDGKAITCLHSGETVLGVTPGQGTGTVLIAPEASAGGAAAPASQPNTKPRKAAPIRPGSQEPQSEAPIPQRQ